jgi:transposase InsO family protein
MANDLRTQVVLDALDMAIHQRKPNAVIHHSDQGSQYTSLAFGLRCKEAGVRPSMGSVADCYDFMCTIGFGIPFWLLLGSPSWLRVDAPAESRIAHRFWLERRMHAA